LNCFRGEVSWLKDRWFSWLLNPQLEGEHALLKGIVGQG